jgi:hypothetical protein
MRPVPPKAPKDSTKPLRQVAVDDVAVMRKVHPCGSFEWTVTRVGADIGLRCVKCGRRLMLPRLAFEKGARHLLDSHPGSNDALWDTNAGPEDPEDEAVP